MDSSPDWDAYWSQTEFTSLVGTSFFTEIFNVFIPDAGPEATAVEIGCFPGRFIEYIGRKGYIVSGIDTYPGVVRLNDQLRQQGCRVGCFCRMEFNHLHSQFDLVFSSGFIEHFNDWPAMILKHLACTRPGGRVIIGCPNFASPVQRALHRAVDAPNLDQHVLTAMYPALWGTFLRFVGIEPLYADYIGPFQFWTDTPHPSDSAAHKLQQACVDAGKWLSQIKGAFASQESGYCLLVADKPRSWSADPQIAAMVGEECMKMAAMIDARDARLSQYLLNALRTIVQP